MGDETLTPRKRDVPDQSGPDIGAALLAATGRRLRPSSAAALFWVVAAHRIDGKPFSGFAHVFVTRCGDFEHFYFAALAMREGGDLYASGEGGYIYPRLIAFLFMPLTLFSVKAAALIMLVLNISIVFEPSCSAEAKSSGAILQARDFSRAHEEVFTMNRSTKISLSASAIAALVYVGVIAATASKCVPQRRTRGHPGQGFND